jgi:hypothetical protein
VSSPFFMKDVRVNITTRRSTEFHVIGRVFVKVFISDTLLLIRIDPVSIQLYQPLTMPNQS